MYGDTHAYIAGAVAQGVALAVGLHYPIIFTSTAIIGALCPDIDHPKAPVSRCCPPLSHYITSKYGHRGFTHSFAALLDFAFVLWVVSLISTAAACLAVGVPFAVMKSSITSRVFTACCGGLLGYLSHLLADTLNRSGVPLLYPYPTRYHIACVELGSSIEHLIQKVAFLALASLTCLICFRC